MTRSNRGKILVVDIFGSFVLQDIQLDMFVGDCPSVDIDFINNNANFYTNELADVSTIYTKVYEFLRQIVVTKHSIEHVGLRITFNFCKNPYFLGTKYSELELTLETLKHKYTVFYNGKSKYFAHQVGWMILKV